MWSPPGFRSVLTLAKPPETPGAPWRRCRSIAARIRGGDGSFGPKPDAHCPSWASGTPSTQAAGPVALSFLGIRHRETRASPVGPGARTRRRPKGVAGDFPGGGPRSCLANRRRRGFGSAAHPSSVGGPGSDPRKARTNRKASSSSTRPRTRWRVRGRSRSAKSRSSKHQSSSVTLEGEEVSPVWSGKDGIIVTLRDASSFIAVRVFDADRLSLFSVGPLVVKSRIRIGESPGSPAKRVVICVVELVGENNVARRSRGGGRRPTIGIVGDAGSASVGWARDADSFWPVAEIGYVSTVWIGDNFDVGVCRIQCQTVVPVGREVRGDRLAVGRVDLELLARMRELAEQLSAGLGARDSLEIVGQGFLESLVSVDTDRGEELRNHHPGLQAVEDRSQPLEEALEGQAHSERRERRHRKTADQGLGGTLDGRAQHGPDGRVAGTRRGEDAVLGDVDGHAALTCPLEPDRRRS